MACPEQQVTSPLLMRVTTMGELAASIAHEVTQPLAGIVAHGSACRRWLAATPPNLYEANRASPTSSRWFKGSCKPAVCRYGFRERSTFHR
jgi:hypothetical protein